MFVRLLYFIMLVQNSMIQEAMLRKEMKQSACSKKHDLKNLHIQKNLNVSCTPSEEIDKYDDCLLSLKFG